jgi:D-amino-acid dehydrogenase
MTPVTTGGDVVVVGGGIVGLSLAYELVTAGATTVLVDRHDPGRATDAGAGILSPETNRDPDPEFFRFGLAAAAHYATLVERLAEDGAAETGYAVTGTLLVAERPGDDAPMADAVALIEGRSPAATREIEPEDARRHFPPMGPVRRALFNPAGRRVDGRTLSGALRRAAVNRGLRMVAADVIGLDADAGRGTVAGVVTADGEVAADTVILAGGAWTAEAAAWLGAAVPVAPLKGQIVHLTLTGVDSRAWSIVQPVLGFYLVPWPDGRVACGGTMEAQAGFDHRPTADGLHQLLREGLRTAPGLAQATVTDVRVGSRPVTPDDRPILGPVPGWSNLLVATGHGAEGLLLGPYSALLVASDALGSDGPGPPDEVELARRLLAAYSLDRFAP